MDGRATADDFEGFDVDADVAAVAECCYHARTKMHRPHPRREKMTLVVRLVLLHHPDVLGYPRRHQCGHQFHCPRCHQRFRQHFRRYCCLHHPYFAIVPVNVLPHSCCGRRCLPGHCCQHLAADVQMRYLRRNNLWNYLDPPPPYQRPPGFAVPSSLHQWIAWTLHVVL